MKAIHFRAVCARRYRKSRRARRRSLTAALRKEILKKTGGACHICGDRVGTHWQADHVVPRHLGGRRTVDNYLPICPECNGLRWSHEPKVLRLIMRMGVYAKNAIRHDRPLGKAMIRVLQQRFGENRKRRNGTRAR
jgi:5-methylcytosine-specific restriction endonuclease McrA